MSVAHEAVYDALIAATPLAVIILSAFLVCLFRGIKAERNDRRNRNG